MDKLLGVGERVPPDNGLDPRAPHDQYGLEANGIIIQEGLQVNDIIIQLGLETNGITIQYGLHVNDSISQANTLTILPGPSPHEWGCPTRSPVLAERGTTYLFPQCKALLVLEALLIEQDP